MQRLHGTVFFLVPDHAHVLKPSDHLGTVFGQGADQFRLVGEMAAADGVQIMDGWGILRRDGRLHTALRHHRICVAKPQFRYDKRFYALFHGGNRGPAPGPAAADNQKVGFVMRIVEINLFRLDP